MLTRGPEAPFILSGILVIATSIKKDGKVTATAFRGVIAAIFLTIITSATAGTKFGTVVWMLGILSLIATASLAVRTWTTT